MKIRNSFVSNSSSSSFIIISSDGCTTQNIRTSDGVFILGEYGEVEFGWQTEKYDDMYSKINFCYIQAKQINNQNYLDMLEKELKEQFPEINTILPIISDDWKCEDTKISHPVDYSDIQLRYGYIDHQSSSIESQNLNMFDSEESLKNFLFNSSSYIQNDNDNH